MGIKKPFEIGLFNNSQKVLILLTRGAMQSDNIPFKAHEPIMKDDIYERAKTVKKICETIWSLDYYKNEIVDV